LGPEKGPATPILISARAAPPVGISASANANAKPSEASRRMDAALRGISATGNPAPNHSICKPAPKPWGGLKVAGKRPP
jgi:hypothetical protein